MKALSTWYDDSLHLLRQTYLTSDVESRKELHPLVRVKKVDDNHSNVLSETAPKLFRKSGAAGDISKRNTVTNLVEYVKDHLTAIESGFVMTTIAGISKRCIE